ncbi:thiol reductant ABC exporter subunit CydC [Actinomadura sp. DC4]|uniref:thiol reductant ABC exporter subunit CydC n=1 Tax=Actinomadura sp. DC4 TaxID=3055069 RepID=UPI0025AEDAE4|nr:thiol reductant ABC exporter subunit CydC [Actinomadura sp. DC4]MDN3359766.1 thiol reductant ABC exporter subunit CydC [Actinomadura sp. DC4]
MTSHQGLASDPLLRLLAPARPLRGRLVLAALAGAATTAAGIALLATSGFLIARAAQHPNVTALAVAVVAVRALGIGRGVFRYAERLTSHDVAFRVMADVRVRIYTRLERLVPLRDTGSGDLLTRLVSDADAVQELVVRGMIPALSAFAAGAGAVLLCGALLVPGGAALAAGLLLAGVAVPWLSAAGARHAGRRTTEARARLAAQTVDTLNGARELIVYGAAGLALRQTYEADADLTAQARRTAMVQGLGTGAATLLGGLTVWTVLLLGVAAGTPHVPLAVLVLTALAAFEAVTALPAAAAQLGQTRAAARRITGILDTPDPMPAPADPVPAPGPPATIRVRGARLRYEPDDPWVLDGVDLDLTPGRRVALVGPSGAGKSTLAAVLLRFRDLDDGAATLNGVPLTAYDPDGVRGLVGGVPQDPHVFATTMRENLRLARPGASDPELSSAAARAGLLERIESLPEGWDTVVGAQGLTLSGGERQRLALARALLADPDVLILDEPTAHLDPDARRALTADLLDATRGRTTLLITHDLDGLEGVDEVVVLDHGRVVQRGTHRDLLGRDGRYRALHDAAV